MSTAAWVCDSCESNNLAGATVCRVCQRKPGSATGTVRSVPAPVALPPPAKITLTPVPTPRIPPPVRKAPVRSPPPPVKKTPARRPLYPLPPARPRPVRRVSGRRARRTIRYVIVGLFVLYVVSHLGSWLNALATPTAAPRSTTPACPAAVATWLPGGSDTTLIAAYTTDRHVITVCRDSSGQLYYDGQLKDSAPTAETHISIPAEQTPTGFIARNKNYVYEITATEVVVTIDDKEYARSPLTRTAP